MTKIVLLIVLFIILLLVFYNKNEHAGALMQLYAKGPQDYYLTGNTYYNPYYNPYRFPPYFYWNQPTRFRRNGAPYLLLTPDRYLYW